MLGENSMLREKSKLPINSSPEIKVKRGCCLKYRLWGVHFLMNLPVAWPYKHTALARTCAPVSVTIAAEQITKHSVVQNSCIYYAHRLPEVNLRKGLMRRLLCSIMSRAFTVNIWLLKTSKDQALAIGPFWAQFQKSHPVLSVCHSQLELWAYEIQARRMGVILLVSLRVGKLSRSHCRRAWILGDMTVFTLENLICHE